MGPATSEIEQSAKRSPRGSRNAQHAVRQMLSVRGALPLLVLVTLGLLVAQKSEKEKWIAKQVDAFVPHAAKLAQASAADMRIPDPILDQRYSNNGCCQGTGVRGLGKFMEAHATQHQVFPRHLGASASFTETTGRESNLLDSYLTGSDRSRIERRKVLINWPKGRRA